MNSFKPWLKWLYTVLVTTSFVVVFVFEDIPDRQVKYRLLKVGAYEHPGADMRNIQMASICKEKGEAYIGFSECVIYAEQVKALYPIAGVPPLNYPSYWVDLYALFFGGSERDFITAWRLNALLTTLVLVVLCYKYQFLLLPFVLFSPAHVLLVERGNIDGLLLFVTFMPLLLFKRQLIVKATFITIAGILKVFPLFGLLGLLDLKKPRRIWQLVLPVLLLSPFLISTLSELRLFESLTSRDYRASFGVPTFGRIPTIANLIPNEMTLYILVATMVIVLATLIHYSGVLRRPTHEMTDTNDNTDRQMVLVSLSIVVLTFLATSNWAYRFVYAIPAMLVLSKQRDYLSSALSVLIFATLWSPFFSLTIIDGLDLLRDGWLLFNYVSFLFSLLAAAYLLAYFATKLLHLYTTRKNV